VEARSSVPNQISPEAYPASYAMGTRSHPGIKQLGCGADHLSPSSTEDGLELYLCIPSVPAQACHDVSFTFTVQENTQLTTLK